jgi:hypothetical protein
MIKPLLGLTLLIGFPAPAASTLGQEREVTVEQAAREYRIQIYERFRLDRDQYNLHREAGDELLRIWRAAGAPAERREAVVQWYEGAAETALASRVSSLPPLPVLEVPNPVEASPPEFAPFAESQTPAPDADTSQAAEDATSSTPPAGMLEAPGLSAPLDLSPPAAPSASKGSSPILSSMRRAVLRAANFSETP